MNTECDAFYRYLFQVFSRAVEEASNGIVQEESFVGSLFWNVKGKYNNFDFDVVYATPCWEDELNKIQIGLYNTKAAEWESIIFIDFPFDDWTMDVNKDCERYCLTVKKYLKEVLNIETPVFFFK